uniref:Uncharacterized protein n=1 Tax=Anguilla anguilla TaxID=7936 RepID=A0A0E9T812_ANGAN
MNSSHMTFWLLGLQRFNSEWIIPLAFYQHLHA